MRWLVKLENPTEITVPFNYVPEGALLVKSDGKKAIPGFAGYYITRGGKVYSSRQGGEDDMREVTSTAEGHKYRRVVLMKNGKKTTKYIHDLLVAAFKGGKNDGQVVRHLDGDKTNNSASNVKPGSEKENVEDRKRHDKSKR